MFFVFFDEFAQAPHAGAAQREVKHVHTPRCCAGGTSGLPCIPSTSGLQGHTSEMKPSSALIIGGAYLSYTIASWSPERREAVVQMIRDGVSGAVNAFLEDPVGCLRRFWEEKKRSPMLLLALASKLMADNLRRKRLKREAARAEAAPAKPAAPGRKKRK